MFYGKDTRTGQILLTHSQVGSVNDIRGQLLRDGIPAEFIETGEEDDDVVGRWIKAYDDANAAELFVSLEDFEGRFSSVEWDNATDFIYEVNLSTGKPKRGVLVQALARAQARNRVDLLSIKIDAFLQVLVSGDIITEQRKTEILTP